MIIAAAIKKGGTIYTLPRPARHHDILHLMINGYELPTPIVNEEQGFLDDHAGFVDRKEAVAIAKLCGQIEEPKYQPNALFSEDLW